MNVVRKHPFKKFPVRAVFHALVEMQRGKMIGS